jgi:hypothetical protein
VSREQRARIKKGISFSSVLGDGREVKHDSFRHMSRAHYTRRGQRAPPYPFLLHFFYIYLLVANHYGVGRLREKKKNKLAPRSIIEVKGATADKGEANIDGSPQQTIIRFRSEAIGWGAASCSKSRSRLLRASTAFKGISLT